MLGIKQVTISLREDAWEKREVRLPSSSLAVQLKNPEGKVSKGTLGKGPNAMVRLGGLEPPTKSLGNFCSIHLSYSRSAAKYSAPIRETTPEASGRGTGGKPGFECKKWHGGENLIPAESTCVGSADPL